MPGGYTEPLDLSSSAAGGGGGYRAGYQYANLGSEMEEVEMDDGSGTRSYHHPIPGLSKGYRREGGGGGRRARRDSLSDSEEESRM